MGKRAFFAFFLSLLVIIGYNYFIAQYSSKPGEPLDSVESPVESESQTIALETPGSTSLRPSGAGLQGRRLGKTHPEEKGVAEMLRSRKDWVKPAKEVVVQTDLVKLVITSSGARIKSCQLKRHPEERLNVRIVQNRINDIEQVLTRSLANTKEIPQREKDKQKILLKRIEQNPEMAELVSLAAIIDTDFSPAVILPGAEEASFALNTALYQCSKETLFLNRDQPEGQLEFTYTDAQGRRIKKVYSFSNSNYGIGLEIKFLGWEEVDWPAGHFLLFCGPDVGMPEAQHGRRTYGYQGPVTYFFSAQQVPSDGRSYQSRQGWVLKEKYARKEGNIFVRREHSGKIGWTGVENKYFLVALIPTPPAEAVIVEKNQFGEQKVALKVPWEDSGRYNFKVYLGPKKEQRLKEIGSTLEKTIDYGFFSPIARLIYQILVFFSRWTHNFGWAIVLLCLVVKIVFYPLTHRSFESMQKMQQDMKSIQPEMEALREKFKDNPQKLNKELMGLYGKKGVNPLASCQSGCLPLILQMPVFFALYAVLYNSIELRGTPFLGWVQDLSAKDPYYILPILMGVSMFVQQKLTGMGTAGSAQQEQAKMMVVLMPLFLTWIFASLPSGVVLYWLTFNILTALQQLLIKKKQTPTVAT